MTDKDPLEHLDRPTPAMVIEEQMEVRVGLFHCADHEDRLETEFTITFPHDDTLQIMVTLAPDDLTTESWSRLKAVGAQLTNIIMTALEGTNRGETEAP